MTTVMTDFILDVNDYRKQVREYMQRSENIINDLQEILRNSISQSQNIFTLYSEERNKNKVMKSLLEKLATPFGIYIYDINNKIFTCVFCNAELLDNKEGHKEDCPWVEARKLLEE